MNNFLRSLPLLLGLLAPPPAGANVIAVLESHGIDVITRARCGDSRHNVASYYMAGNYVCLNVIGGMNRIAITHEAVHAAQDCLAGLNNKRLKPINQASGVPLRRFVEKLPTSTINHIRRHYPRHLWEIEIEAYALENDPAAVTDILNISCS